MQGILEQAFANFVDACRHLRAPIWRIEPTGHAVGVTDSPAVRAFAECPKVIEQVADMVRRLGEVSDRTAAVTLVPGLQVLCFREVLRRRRFAWIATVVPVGKGPDESTLTQISSLSAEQAGAFLDDLHVAAVADSAQLEARANFMAELHDRCVGYLSDEHTIGEFADQLTASYEYLTMYHRIGKLMGNISEPGEFIEQVLRELLETSQFGWVSFLRLRDEHQCFERAQLPSFSTLFDQSRFHAEQIEQATRAISESAACYSPDPVIIGCSAGIPPEVGPEIVAVGLCDEDRCMGLIALGARSGKEWAVSSHDTLPVQAVAACVAAYLRIIRLYQLERDSFLGTLGAFSTALDAKDSYTQGHSERVAELARKIAQAAHLDPRTVQTVYVAGLVHDVGKIGVPEALLRGGTKLSDADFELIKKHPEIGNRILERVPLLEDALPGVLHHHERWDGAGYPSGLSGSEIPLMARIIAIADSFDAMSSTRTYRAGMDRATVLEEIRSNAGKQFDPDLVDVFLTLDLAWYDRMLESSESQQNQSRAA